MKYTNRKLFYALQRGLDVRLTWKQFNAIIKQAEQSLQPWALGPRNRSNQPTGVPVRDHRRSRPRPTAGCAITGFDLGLRPRHLRAVTFITPARRRSPAPATRCSKTSRRSLAAGRSRLGRYPSIPQITRPGWAPATPVFTRELPRKPRQPQCFHYLGTMGFAK